MKLNKIARSAFFALFALLMPLTALANTLTLGGQNSWTIYVYGDGQAIASILTAIKLMLDPTYGSQTFELVLLFLATLGFLVMAVRAGFDPGKNLLKMFTFVFVVFAVHYSTADLTVNIHIHDRFGSINQTDFYVSGVPAIVGAPAAVISDVGEYLTREIETVFQLPNNADDVPLAITTGGAYGMFEKVMQQMNDYTFSDPNLKQSLSAYMTDCVVPAIALGKISEVDLVNSTDLATLIAKAENNGLMTQFYPSPKQQMALGAACDNLSNNGAGVLVSCTDDYVQCLYPELHNEANNILTSASGNWQTTGTDVPLEAAMTSALQMVGATGGANRYAGYSSPEGYIMQSAMLSASAGSFRHAAAAMGNNSLMMDAAMSQAEQSQRSSWWTAAEIFKDMMGYVFIVLQAFVFAMAPIVIICLMIPGLGSKVFINYAEIMVWLTLWTPLLAIVNFLTEIFGSAQLNGSLGKGMDMLNKGLISERTTNLVIVSQFMATLVPLLAWGVVKGSLAFTELIMGGLGSAFAQQAGAQSSTGNMSLGNMSLDNVGFDKYSTVMSSAVGVQETQAFYGAGAALGTMQGGGLVATENGAPVNPVVSRKREYGIKDSAGNTHQISSQLAHSLADSNSRTASFLKSASEDIGQEFKYANALAKGQITDHKLTNTQRAGLKKDASNVVAAASALKAGVAAEASLSFNPLQWGAKAKIDIAADRTRLAKAEQKMASDEALDTAESYSNGNSISSNSSVGGGTGNSEKAGNVISESQMEGVASTLSSTESFVSSHSSATDYSMSVTTTDSQQTTLAAGSPFSGGADPSTVMSHLDSNAARAAAEQRNLQSQYNAGTKANNEALVNAGHGIGQTADSIGSRARTEGATGLTTPDFTGKSPLSTGRGEAPIGTGMRMDYVGPSTLRSKLKYNMTKNELAHLGITNSAGNYYDRTGGHLSLLSDAKGINEQMGHLSGFGIGNMPTLDYLSGAGVGRVGTLRGTPTRGIL